MRYFLLKSYFLVIVIIINCFLSDGKTFTFPNINFLQKFGKPLKSDSYSDNLNMDDRISFRNVITMDNIIRCASDITIAYLNIRAMRGLLNWLMRDMNKAPNDTIPLHLIKFIPPNCKLTPIEIEMLHNIIDPESIDQGFNSIGGLKETKLLLKDICVDLLSYNSSIDSFLKPTQGVLLFGPPGNGKSMLVNALAKECNIPLLQVTPSMLFRKYVGETSLQLKAIFSLMQKLEPCILFVDEVDALFRSRMEDDHSVDRNLKTEFMQLWDHLVNSQSKVLIIGATNRPQDVDQAFQRRFERSFLVAPPNKEERKEIFYNVLNRLNLAENFDFLKCAVLTEGYSSSDILSLCKAVKSMAYREGKANNSIKAISNKVHLFFIVLCKFSVISL